MDSTLYFAFLINYEWPTDLQQLVFCPIGTHIIILLILTSITHRLNT